MPYRRPRYEEYADLARALKRKARREAIPCHVCGLPIDWNVDWKHRLAFTADHEHAIRDGGDVRGALLVAHRGCNTRRFNLEKAGKATARRPAVRSREW